MIATQSQVACEPRAACAHWRLLGLKLGTPCSLHEWVELIFLAFTLTIPPPCVCPHPARGSELASGTGAQSPLFPHCLSARVALAPFCPQEYVSQLSNAQAHFPTKVSLHVPSGFCPGFYFSKTQCWKRRNHGTSL